MLNFLHCHGFRVTLLYPLFPQAPAGLACCKFPLNAFDLIKLNIASFSMVRLVLPTASPSPGGIVHWCSRSGGSVSLQVESLTHARCESPVLCGAEGTGDASLD